MAILKWRAESRFPVPVYELSMYRRFEGFTAGSMNIPPHEGLGVIPTEVLTLSGAVV